MLKIKTPRYRRYKEHTYKIHDWYMWLYYMGLYETHVILMEDDIWYDWLYTMGLHETDYFASLDYPK